MGGGVMSDSPWKPMEEMPSPAWGVVIIDKTGDVRGYRGKPAVKKHGDLAWCYGHGLNIPTEPVKPKPREPKPGEVWETRNGRRWAVVQGSWMVRLEDGFRLPRSEWSVWAPESGAKLVLPAVGEMP